MPMATKAEQKAYMRDWMRRRRQEWFADKVCAYCGTAENLELDHIDPKTKVTHAVWSWSYTRRMVELAKCQALCEECHKKKSADACRKTHCLRGHSLDDAYISSTDGSRSCRTCCLERLQRIREAKKLARASQ